MKDIRADMTRNVAFSTRDVLTGQHLELPKKFAFSRKKFKAKSQFNFQVGLWPPGAHFSQRSPFQSCLAIRAGWLGRILAL